MEASTLYLIWISLALATVGILTGYLVAWLKKAKNYLIPLNGRNYQPKRIKKQGATQETWIDPTDKLKRPINFPLKPGFSYQDKKGGLRFLADPKTGLLIRTVGDKAAYDKLLAYCDEHRIQVERSGEVIRFNGEAVDFQYMDPRYVLQALQDGRPLQIIRSLNPDPPWVQFALPIIIVMGLAIFAVLFMVYQMYSKAHAGA